MTRQWAMVIGIDHYRALQSLKCAQQDAEAIYAWLIHTAGWSPQTCILSTDTSPVFRLQSTLPGCQELQTWWDWLCQEQIQADDTLWIFFSGYGACWEGKDYLLPIDASTDFSAATWLSLEALFTQLNALPTQQILVLLDINRSQSARAEAQVGRHTARLAHETGIPTLLSCRPEQFAHESLAMRQGLFTTALLEGLNLQAGQPLLSLAHFLKSRLPELSQQHQRPRQDPLVIASAQQLQTWRLPAVAGPAMASPHRDDLPPAPLPSRGQPGRPVVPSGLPDSQSASRSGSRPARRSTPSPATSPSTLGTRQLLWRVVILGILIVVVFSLARMLQDWDRGSPRSPAASPLLSPLNVVPVPTSPPSQPTASPPTGATLSPAPTPTPKPDPSVRLQVPQSPPADSAKILDDARAMIRPTTASEVGRAISRAQQIPPADPRYAEAQRQIARWSRDILDLARQRAQKGRYRDAIAAAQLVPRQPETIYNDAQTEIAQWKQRLRSDNIAPQKTP
jgi:hypothetical protein